MSRRARCAECSCSHDPQISLTLSPFTLGPTGSSESLRSVVASAEVLAREALAAGDPSCPCWLPHAPRAAHWICTSEGIARVLACGFSSAERLSANGFSKFVFSRTLRAPPPLHHHHVAVSGQYSRPLLSSSFFWTDPPGPSAHSTFTPRHPMSTYPGAARKRTPVSLPWAVCAVYFPGLAEHRRRPWQVSTVRRMQDADTATVGPLALTRAREARTAWWWYLRGVVRVAVSRGLPLETAGPAVSRRRPIAACPTRSKNISI